MSIKYNVIVQKKKIGMIAKCIDNSIASQGKSIEEALNNLKEAIELYYQDEKPIMPKQVLVTTVDGDYMSSKIPIVPFKEVVRILQKLGFIKISQKRQSC